MARLPVTLEAVGVRTYAELFELPTAEVIQRLDSQQVKGGDIPLHSGDAFLAVLVLRGVADLAAATRRLETATKGLIWLTVALLVAAVVTVVVDLTT